MEPFKGNIEKLTLENNLYRKVISTNLHQQLVLMSLPPHSDIGMEVHEIISQFIRIEEGKGMAILNGKKKLLKNGDALLIPARTYHNIINNSDTPLKLYTIYSPPNHPVGTSQRVKPEDD